MVKHGGTLRVEDTVPGGEPPGTSIHVVLPGRPIPAAGERRHAGVDMDLRMANADND